MHYFKAVLETGFSGHNNQWNLCIQVRVHNSYFAVNAFLYDNVIIFISGYPPRLRTSEK